jgi:predicted site-specific integrase-resolvase
LKKKPTAEETPINRATSLMARTVQRWIAEGYLEPFYLPGSGRPRIPLDQVVALRKQKERPRSAYRPFASRPGARKPRSR